MRKNWFHARRAVSLTELLFVMSMCTLILSTSGVLLQRVMRIESTSRTFNDSERACTRLSRQFRSDTHLAVSVELNGKMPTDGPLLRLQRSDSVSVEYALGSNDITRTVRDAAKVLSRDEFPLPPLAQIEIKRLKSPERIVLTIAPPRLDAATDTERQLQSYRAVPVGLQVEATLREPHEIETKKD
jgi:hypothetical protein